ncbi:MAG: mannose-1-phosphate guanylyltransferase [Gemmatimonadaceae bacterium]
MTAPLYAVVLAGGVGSRFWPLSTPTRPKQLLPLISDAPMLADSVARLVPLVGAERVLVLTSESLGPAVLAAVPGVTADQLLLEPRPAGTAAALAWAAHAVIARGGPDAQMVCVHSDWAIADDAKFRETLAHAASLAAARGALATVGIVPSRPDPGFGYIQPGDAVGGGARAVARFVEKPDRVRAAEMVAQGFLWNSGIFAWRAQDLLDEIDAKTPELAAAMSTLKAGPAAFFGAVKDTVSIDVGVLERSQRVIVLAGDFGWDDVGTWSALARVRARDAAGNATHGRVIARESSDNVVHAEGSAVVLDGVSGLVVVVRDGVTLVTTVARAADLKKVVETLPSDLKDLP